MLICKVGQDHLNYGINKQDSGYCKDGIKIVTDGCGSSNFSEVGAILFSRYISNQSKESLKPENLNKTIDRFFKQCLILNSIISDDKEKETQFLVDYLTFTFIICVEEEDKYIVQYLGDGFIIVEGNDGIIYLLFQ